MRRMLLGMAAGLLALGLGTLADDVRAQEDATCLPSSEISGDLGAPGEAGATMQANLNEITEVRRNQTTLDDAIAEFKVALWCRETVAGRIALGAALLQSGDRDAARQEAQRALALDPSSTEARELLERIGGGGAAAAVLTSDALA